MNRPPAPREHEPAARRGGWRRLRAAHFHDYTPAAFALWLAITLVGAGAGAVAALSGFDGDAPYRFETLLALLLVALAAWFPVEIPRSKYSFGIADAFIFTALAVLGTPAAVLAAGVEGAVGAWRSTPRLTSRISTPAAAMAAMAVCGALFESATAALVGMGGGVALSKLAALAAVALVPLVLTSLPLQATVTLKRGHWPRLRVWWSGASWMAAVSLGSALLAGMAQLGTATQGPLAAGIVGAGTLVLVLLLRVSIARNEAEHREQDQRIREAEQEARFNHERFVAAFARAAIGMAIVDPGGRILRANEALCSVLRRPESALVGAPFVDLVHRADIAAFERQARETDERQDGPPVAVELRCRAGDGADVWVALNCGRFRDPVSSADGLIYQLHDVSARREAEQRLQHIAYHDSLTDLANRACFHEQLEAAVEASRLDPTLQFAVMFLDLDRFKVINDSLGHLAGNELLREVARRLRRGLREKDLVARLGGDEFAVLLRDARDAGAAMALADRLLRELAAPFRIHGHEVLPGASAGITFSDLGYRTVDELLRDADLAMYEAKAARRGQVAVFDRSMHERIADKLALEVDLRRAIGEGELSLAFQPLYRLDPYRLVGFEALARWTHPVRGPVTPATFITLAEEAGLIEALTVWAVDQALQQLAAWHRASPHLRDTGINVNISGQDLAQPGFADSVQELLRRHGVAPHLLTLEITETVLMSRVDLARDTLARLRAVGVRLAIDDFGTGYSSLAYLSTFPIDCLKIDRSFVAALDRGDSGLEIVRAVLNLGQALGQKVVAEGIETAEQLGALQRLGVQIGQGYLLSHPLRADQVPALLGTLAEQVA